MGKGSFVGYETIELNNYPKPQHLLIHMKAKGRWQILKWIKQHGEWEYKVMSEHPKYKQAQAILILMEK